MRRPLAILLALAACTPAPISPEAAAERCEARARAATGLTGEVTIGANSRTGGFTEASVGLTSDYLLGRDPLDVYDSCVRELSGQGPIRPPRLP